MDENVLQTPPDFKLYKDRAVYVGTFLGGPLVAGYLAAENFKQLGQIKNIKRTWLITIGATILIFGSIFLIPNINKIPGYIIPLIYTLIAQLLIQRFQGTAIKQHIENGGPMYSVWRAVWIGLIGLAITLVLLFIIVTLSSSLSFDR